MQNDYSITFILMYKSLYHLILFALLVTSCNSSNKANSTIEKNERSLAAAKLPRVLDKAIALGFPKIEGLAPSTGKLNMTVLFVDFEDVPATQSVDSVFSIINPIAPEFFNEISYGTLELNFKPHFKWIRLSKQSTHYAKGIYEFLPHRAFIQEAVDLAEDQVDFSETDVVLVLSNPDAKTIDRGPTFKSLDPDYQIKADGKNISTAITSGYDLNYWGGLWLPHETGHTFGLPDLYHFGSERWNRYVGTFGLMGTIAAKAPGYFAFERWILGWLDDAQIQVHEKGEATFNLEALETVGGTKAVVVPLDSTSALVVESRRAIGFDQNIPKEGALVYLVDTKFPGGSGPIQVISNVSSGDEFLQQAPLAEGESLKYERIHVEVLKASTTADRVKVWIKEKE